MRVAGCPPKGIRSEPGRRGHETETETRLKTSLPEENMSIYLDPPSASSAACPNQYLHHLFVHWLLTFPPSVSTRANVISTRDPCFPTFGTFWHSDTSTHYSISFFLKSLISLHSRRLSRPLAIITGRQMKNLAT